MRWILLPIIFLAPLFALAKSASVEAMPPVKQCEMALAPTPFLGQQVYSDYVILPSGSEIYVRIEQPRFVAPKGWFFLVHGLMDSHRGYDELTRRLIRRGYGVVRMDLHGFARSLHREAERAKAAGHSFTPALHIDYNEQVRDLKELLVVLRERFQIERPHLVGHSMGGGLSIALLADADGQALVGTRATVIAPYVYRLEYYLMEKVLFSTVPVGNSIPTLNAMVPSLLKVGPEFLTDTFIGNAAMSDTFGQFFDNLGAKRLPKIAEAEWQVIRERHVSSAIAAVKGLRDLNTIDKAALIPNGTIVDLIYGHNDKIVEENLARRLGRVLVSRGGREFALNAGHMSISENPDQVADILIRRY